MSGLVNGLQNRLQQFESARHLKGRRDCIIHLMQSLLLFFNIQSPRLQTISLRQLYGRAMTCPHATVKITKDLQTGSLR